MSAKKVTKAKSGVETLELRVSRLEQDMKKLVTDSKKKNKQSSAEGFAQFMRNTGIVALVILTALLLNAAVAATWLNRTLLDTDRWVEKTTAIVSDPNVRADISRSVTDEIFNKADVETYVAQILPEQVDGLAVPLTSSMKDFTTKRVDTALQTDAFLQFWQNANKSAHAGIIESLENGGASTAESSNNLVYIQDDVMYLSLRPVFAALQTRLSDAGLTFVNRVDPAQVTRTIELGEIKNMPAVMVSFNLLKQSVLVLPLLAVASGLTAIYLARDRRKVLMAMSAVTAVFLVLGVQTVYLVQYPVIDAIAASLSNGSTASGQAIYTILTEDLVLMNRVLLAVSLLVIVGTFLSGTSASATWLRKKFGSLVTRNNGEVPAVQWTALHAQGLVIAISIVTLLLLVFPLVEGPVFPIVIVSIAVIVSFIILSIRQSINTPPPKKQPASS
jgi:hypothetical protein